MTPTGAAEAGGVEAKALAPNLVVIGVGTAGLTTSLLASSLGARVALIERHLMGGDCALTPARCLLEEVGGRVMIRLHPEEVRNRVPGADYAALMLERGDGRVTKASLLARDSLAPDVAQPGFFPITYAVFICRGHAELPADMTFRDNPLNILLD